MNALPPPTGSESQCHPCSQVQPQSAAAIISPGKACTKCGRDLLLSEFSPDRRKKSGHQAWCKDCAAAYSCAKRHGGVLPPGYERKRNLPAAKMTEEERRAKRRAAARVRKCSPEQVRRWNQRSYRTRGQYNASCRTRYQAALRAGVLRPPGLCEWCDKAPEYGKIHGHHEDYADPLNVWWLCPACHGGVHSGRIALPDRIAPRETEENQAALVNAKYRRLAQRDNFAFNQEAWRIEAALTRLSKRQRKIIEMHYGLNRRRPRTLEQIGKKLGITAEAVRQAEARALEKLRIQLRDSVEE